MENLITEPRKHGEKQLKKVRDLVSLWLGFGAVYNEAMTWSSIDGAAIPLETRAVRVAGKEAGMYP